MKTFVINLPSAKDRLKNISKQLKGLEIEHEIFSATYGKNLTEEELRTLYDSKKANEFLGKDLTLGEIGCALSHRGVWERMVKENVNIALILEDDAIISNNIKCVYNKLNKEGTKWDYILLSYGIFNKKEIKRYGLYIYDNFFKRGKILKFFTHFFGMLFFSIIDHILIFMSKIFGPFIVKKYKPQYSTVGYFITKQGAMKLLKIYNKIFLPSDLLPEKFGKSVNLKFAITVPRLISRNDELFNSCIDEAGGKRW